LFERRDRLSLSALAQAGSGRRKLGGDHLMEVTAEPLSAADRPGHHGCREHYVDHTAVIMQQRPDVRHDFVFAAQA
jgi:hypothetical protein